MDGVSAIVMDEAHFIQDNDRGHVWEETLILCKGPMPLQLVLLSATMPSAKSVATWISDLHQRQTVLLSTTYRIVPLVHGVLSDKNEVIPLMDAFGGWTDGYTTWLKSRKTRALCAAAHKKAVENRLPGQPPPAHKIKEESATARLLRNIAWLHETGETPALFFVFSRKECERYAALVPNTLLDTSETATVKHMFDFHLSRHKIAFETSAQYHTIRDLLSRGIAFHHSGLQPLLKEIVEILFTRKFVKILFATETFAVGLNMPTKTVVFLGLSKFSNDGHGHGQSIIRPDEYIQMAGRAGRRGLDARGLVLYEPMHDPLEPYELKGLLTGSLRPFTSRMLFNYDFILKLQTPLIESSYWALEQGKRRDELTARFKHIEDKIHTYSDLQESKQMTEYDELQTQVRTTVNAKQKRAKQALSLWMMANDTKDLPARVLRFENNKQMREEYLGLLQELRVPTLNLDGKIECLKSWGFLVLDLDAALTLTLTLRGMCATEVNEGHTILMPLLADAECMKPLTGEEIAVVLATFLTDGIDSSDSTEASDVLNGVTSAWIQQTCKDCMALSASETPPEYWKLSHVWPVVVQRWLSGATVTEIAAEFGLFEGNVFRGLLRVANLLEEWSAIATLRKDLPTLEKLATLNFLRGEIVPDSLYLRL
jgi:superfamily II RNA helicase